MAKAKRVGVDIGELLGLLPIVATITAEAQGLRAVPKGPRRRQAVQDLVMSQIGALVTWLDDALDD